MLAEAVHAAARGDALIAPNVTVRLLEAFAGPAQATAASRARPSPLTAREQEVLAAVARGLGNTEIAGELHISLSTVKTHLASLMTKLGVRNRVEIAIWALGRGSRPAGPTPELNGEPSATSSWTLSRSTGNAA